MQENPDPFVTLYQIVDGLNRKFPTGNNPLQIITRLCEEAGELAVTVNHFEGAGVKMEKHGEPDKKALADEAQHVIRAVLAVVRHYRIERELEDSIIEFHGRLTRDGHV